MRKRVLATSQTRNRKVMITFKENTFVKGNYDELMEMAKAIEEKGG